MSMSACILFVILILTEQHFHPVFVYLLFSTQKCFPMFEQCSITDIVIKIVGNAILRMYVRELYDKGYVSGFF